LYKIGGENYPILVLVEDTAHSGTGEKDKIFGAVVVKYLACSG
jgi:hypothetical protein